MIRDVVEGIAGYFRERPALSAAYAMVLCLIFGLGLLSSAWPAGLLVLFVAAYFGYAWFLLLRPQAVVNSFQSSAVAVVPRLGYGLAICSIVALVIGLIIGWELLKAIGRAAMDALNDN